MKGKIFALIISIALLFSPLSIFADESSDYDGHYAQSSIRYLFDKNIVTGYEDGSFGPDRAISRAEFITIINRAFSITKEGLADFSDVQESDWFFDEVKKATGAGYISGYDDGTLKPHNDISRQEAAVILSRILDIGPLKSAQIYSKLDVFALPYWSLDAVLAMASQDLMLVDDNKDFRPSAQLYRADMAIAIERSLTKKIDLKDDSEFSQGEYETYSESIMDTYNESNYLLLEGEGNTLKLTGNLTGSNTWSWLQVVNANKEGSKREIINPIKDGQLNLKISNIRGDGDYKAILYLNKSHYGTYNGYAQYDFSVINGKILIPKSPVDDHNKRTYHQRTKSDVRIKLGVLSEDDKTLLLNTIDTIIEDKETDYAKIMAISNWISSNIYYDQDMFNNISPRWDDAINTFKTRRSVCQGYSDLALKMLTLAGYDTKMVIGYALGMSANNKTLEEVSSADVNHAWNEVFLDGRWIIIDTTWNSQNKFENGKYETPHPARITYFDATPQMFSYTHKIGGYIE